MRQGEPVALRWENVDLTRRIANLPDTKNGEARTVPLSSTSVEVLRTLPRSLDGQVFPGLTAEAVKRAFARATRRASIENLHFHDLRHEATTRLFERGLNLMEVATITGHKDLRMLRRYTHLKAEDLVTKLRLRSLWDCSTYRIRLGLAAVSADKPKLKNGQDLGLYSVGFARG